MCGDDFILINCFIKIVDIGMGINMDFMAGTKRTHYCGALCAADIEALARD